MVQIQYVEPKNTERLPVVAQEKFISCKSGEYGWFTSTDFVLPFIVEKKFIFRRVVFTSPSIFLGNEENYQEADEVKFLEDVTLKSRELGVDFIYQPMTYAVFSAIPEKSTYCKALTYQVGLTKSEDELFKALHTKHRNVIKKSEKDGVEIFSGPEVMDECFEVIKQTMQRQNKPYVSYEQVCSYKEKLGENIAFYIAKKDNVVQGSAIFIWSKGQLSYYFHGGSIPRPHTGAVNLLQWKAMCDMKKNGVKIFDFVGGRVAPLKGSKQEGIQRFKSRFGAEGKVGYLWKVPVNPFRYWLFRMVAHLNAFKSGRKYLGDIIDEEIKNAKQ